MSQTATSGGDRQRITARSGRGTSGNAQGAGAGGGDGGRGLKEAVAPAGSPLTPSETVPVKPVPAVTVKVKDVPLTCTTVCEEGEAEREKSGWTVMVRVGGLGSVRPALSVTVKVVT